MSSAPAAKPKDDPAVEQPIKKNGKGKLKLILIAAPVLLICIGAGLWFTGVLPHLLGMDKHEDLAAEAPKPVLPSFIDIPEMIANLNGAHKPSYIKLAARVEVPTAEDAEKVKAAMPRLQDIFQTYLREMRPEELRGSAGTYRLREELLTRANAAVAPAKVSDILFTQMLVQ
jgi:flagellar protein FliL